MNGSVKIFIPILIFMASLGAVSWVVIDNLTERETVTIAKSRIVERGASPLPSSDDGIIHLKTRIPPVDVDEFTRRMLAEGLIELPRIIVTPETPPVSKPEPAVELPEPAEKEIIPDEIDEPDPAPEEKVIPEPESIADDPSDGMAAERVSEPIPDVKSPVGYKFAPEPEYPRAAERSGIEGTVLLRVRVGAEGQVLEAAIIESSGHKILDDSALKSVIEIWKFHPATLNGTPVEKWAEIPIIFTLDITDN